MLRVPRSLQNVHFFIQNDIKIDVLLEGPIKLPSIKVATDKPNPQIGVSSLAWSPDGTYIASKNGIHFMNVVE